MKRQCTHTVCRFGHSDDLIMAALKDRRAGNDPDETRLGLKIMDIHLGPVECKMAEPPRLPESASSDLFAAVESTPSDFKTSRERRRGKGA